MPGQTVYQDQVRGFPGQRQGMGHKARSMVNDTGAVRQVHDVVVINVPTAQVDRVTITGTTDGTYTVTINGVGHDFVASSSTDTEIRDGLQAAIIAGSQPVTPTDVSTDALAITADVAGVPFTIAVTGPGGPDITTAVTTANVGGTTVFTFTVDVGSGALPVTYTGLAGDLTTVQIRDGLLAAARAEQSFENRVAFNPTGTDTIRATALVQGTGFTLAESDANLTNAAITANVATITIPFGRAVVNRSGAGTTERSAALPTSTGQTFAGVAERIHSNVDPSAASPADDIGAIAAFQDMTVIKEGEVIVEVEEAVLESDNVFFRHTAGAGENLGTFRTDADTADADQITNARWVSRTTGAGLAVLAINTA